MSLILRPDQIDVKRGVYESIRTGEDKVVVQAMKEKAIRKEYQALYQSENKERIATQKREYRIRNKDKISAQRKKYRDDNKKKVASQKKEFYEKNRDSVLKKNQEYYESNKDDIFHKRKLYRKKNKVVISSQRSNYRKKNKKLIKLIQQEYHTKNKARLNALSRQYNKKNKKAISEQKKYYAKNNKGIINSNVYKRKAAKLNRTPSWSNYDEIKQFYINTPDGMTVDHVLPLQGEVVSGLHVVENLQYLTSRNNSVKGNRVTNELLLMVEEEIMKDVQL